jgi:hypothetical protein
MTSSRPALVAAPDISLHLGRSRRDRPAPSLALLLDPPQPVGFVFVGIVSGRRRYQLRALLAEMIETTAQLEPASVCWSLAQSPQPLSPPLCPARYPPQGLAACRYRAALRILSRMGTKSRETIYGASVRAAAERAAEARKQADRLAVEAWNKRMLGFQGPAQPSPTLGDAINAGFGYLEVKCLGCNTHQTVALDIVRRPKATPVHELERYMRCRQCSEVRRYPFKRSHLVALRPSKVSASDPPSTWWPGER